MAGESELTQRALERVAACDNPKELRRIAENAKRLENDEVARAAQRKLYAVSPDAEPGTFEHDVWQSIFALEGALTDERGKTTLLARTRQKIARQGELDTVADLIRKPPSDGYKMLVDRSWPELTFEAVALRHPERFEAHILEAAMARLDASGVEV